MKWPIEEWLEDNYKPGDKIRLQDLYDAIDKHFPETVSSKGWYYIAKRLEERGVISEEIEGRVLYFKYNGNRNEMQENNKSLR
ncbi:hypothetical protein J7K74_00655 [Candidatus Woesearchaeota archaeon]|nr:hypothetical protein [Candidatus Woesearchaeota archaeon]